MQNDSFKFRGGAWIGSWQITWPFITLEITKEHLTLKNELFGTSYNFTHEGIERIEIKRYFPIVACGIRIWPRDKSKHDTYYFWYWSFHFDRFIDTLKKFSWL
jgi:hypothetical protein